MKPVIGVMGPSAPRSDHLVECGRRVGTELARRGAILLTGATTGCSLAAAEGAAKAGGLVIGISPAEGPPERRSGDLVSRPHEVILYSGFGSHGRNVLNIRGSDAVVFVGASIGTINEFTIAYDLAKPIGILDADGAEIYRQIEASCAKPGRPPLIFEADPERLVAAVWSLAGFDRG